MKSVAAPERVSLRYVPRAHQQIIHAHRRRFSIAICHRRFGKTNGGIGQLVDAALKNPFERSAYAYVAPYRSQAKKIAWDLLKHTVGNIPGTNIKEGELKISLPNGALIQLAGSDNPDTLRGLGLDGVVLDEYADMDPDVWGKVIRPSLADRKGWALFIGTPKGRNHFYRMIEQARSLDNWQVFVFRASETGIIDADELADAKATMSPDAYAQEFECSFDAAQPGAYYAQQMAALRNGGRIRSVPFNDALLVNTAWDLGMDDETVIWFHQMGPDGHRFIDYYAASGEPLSHYVQVLQERADSLGYVYDRHFLPHDVEVRELASGDSRRTSLEKLGVTRIETVRTPDLAAGIELVRQMLPECWFDADRCQRGLDALTSYAKEYDARRETFRGRPRHDWTSHSADALRMFAQGWREPTKLDESLPPTPHNWMG